MKNLLLKIIGVLGGVLFALLEISGIYHAAFHHSSGDAALAFFVPPYAWYRSIESFYHTTESDDTSIQDLSEDMDLCVYFLNEGISGSVEPEQLYGEVKEYSKKINLYQKLRLRQLKDMVISYIMYQIAFDEALLESLEYSKTVDKFSFRKTEKLDSSEQLMYKFRMNSLVLPQNELEIISENVNRSINSLGQDTVSISIKIDKFIEQFTIQSKYTIRNFLSIYEAIFGERF